MVDTTSFVIGYHNPGINDNYELVTPFQNPYYEDGYANLLQLLKAITDMVELAKQLTSYKMRDIQTISEGREITVDPAFSLQIIPILGATTPGVTTNKVPFVTLTAGTAIRNGTIVKLVGWSDTNTVTLPYNDTGTGIGIKSSGNVLLKKYYTAEYMYFEIGTEKGWLRNAKTP